MKQIFSIVIFFILGFAVFCQEAVDLGLSVEWATSNIGANLPEEYGNYYTFDEAQELSDSNWRVPTQDEINELLANSNYKWTTQNGVHGGLFTSKKNGNSIFLPAAGDHIGSDVYGVGSLGFYWSLSANDSDKAYYLEFGNDYAIEDSYYRNYSQSVRLVRDLCKLEKKKLYKKRNKFASNKNRSISAE